MKPHEYISQISKKDMEEIAAVTNLEAGWLIRIEKVDGKVVVSIDQNAFAQALNGFIRNSGGTVSGADSTSISFDPPS